MGLFEEAKQEIHLLFRKLRVIRDRAFWIIVVALVVLLGAVALILQFNVQLMREGKQLPYREYLIFVGIMIIVLILLYIIYTLVIRYRFRPEAGDSLFSRFLREDERYAAMAQVITAVMNLPALFDKQRPEIYLPIINPVDVCYELIRIRAEQLSNGQVLQLFAFHVIPEGRAEAYWWRTRLGSEYFQQQRNLIRAGKLAVKRILITASKNVTRDDFHEWVALSAAGIEVEWALGINNMDQFNQGCDFGLLQTIDKSGVVVRSDLMVEKYNPGEPRPWILLKSVDTEESSGTISQYNQLFEEHWGNYAHNKIPQEVINGESNNPSSIALRLHEVLGNKTYDQEHNLDGGVFALYNALGYIENAKEFIFAMDISDIKEGIEAVYRDSVYKSWYETTISKITKVKEFHRIYVLKRDQRSIECFMRDHLTCYFQQDGNCLKGCRVDVVFMDDLMKGIEGYSDKEIQDWFIANSNLKRHLNRTKQWNNGDIRANFKKILIRDFLITESSIYDYRSDTARFELDSLPDYLQAPQQRHETLEWKEIGAMIIKLSPTITGTTLGTVKGALEGALKGVASPK